MAETAAHLVDYVIPRVKVATVGALVSDPAASAAEAFLGATAKRIEELHELAVLKDEFDSPAAAKPLLELLLRQPRNSFHKAALLYGYILLDKDNDRGLDYLM